MNGELPPGSTPHSTIEVTNGVSAPAARPHDSSWYQDSSSARSLSGSPNVSWKMRLDLNVLAAIGNTTSPGPNTESRNSHQSNGLQRAPIASLNTAYESRSRSVVSAPLGRKLSSNSAKPRGRRVESPAWNTSPNARR